MSIFFQRLDQARREKGLRLTEVGRLCGISPQGVQTWKRIKNVPTEHLNTLAEYFNVSIDWLLGRTDERHPGAYPEARSEPMILREVPPADDRLRHIEKACADVAADVKIIKAALATLLAEQEHRGAHDHAKGNGLKAG